jgi:predicted transcriptional regulator
MNKTQTQFSLVLRLPESVLHQVDDVAAACRMSRSAYIRKSIARNLAFTQSHELPLLESPELQEALST